MVLTKSRLCAHMIDITYVILMLACVGFVLTAQTAFATNESSYKVGFSIAIDQYSGCNDTDDSTCPSNDVAISECYKGTTDDKGLVVVTNSTACMDGYVNGFKHWCQQDTKVCIDVVTKCGCAPSIYINENKTALKEAASSIIPQLAARPWNFVNRSSGVSGTMTFGLVSPTSQSAGTSGPAMDFNQTIDGKTLLAHYRVPREFTSGSTGYWSYGSSYGSHHELWLSSRPTLSLNYDTTDNSGICCSSHLTIRNITVTALSPEHIQLQYPVKTNEPKEFGSNPILIDLYSSGARPGLGYLQP